MYTVLTSTCGDVMDVCGCTSRAGVWVVTATTDAATGRGNRCCVTGDVTGMIGEDGPFGFTIMGLYRLP